MAAPPAVPREEVRITNKEKISNENNENPKRRKSMKKMLFSIGAAVLALALLLTLAPACGNGGGEVKTLKMGFMGPLSGPAAGWGVDAEKGAKWAADRINAAGGIKVGDDRYMVSIVSKDTKATGSVAAEGATALVYDEGIHYAVGPIITQDAVDPILTEGKCFYGHISGGAWLGPDIPYRLNTVSTTEQWISAFLGMAADQHPEIETVAIIHREGPTAEEAMDISEAEAVANGLEVVATAFVPSGQTDFYPILTKILPEDPEAVFSHSLMPGDAALIIKQARELGYEGWFWFGNGTPTETFFDIAGRENCWKIATNIPDYSSDIYSGKVRDLNEEWLRDYARPGETEILLVTTAAYNGIMVFAQAIEEAGSIDPDEVMKVLDDPDFRFDIFNMDDVALGGIQLFGIRRHIPHPSAYGEIIDADNVQLSVSEVLMWSP